MATLKLFQTFPHVMEERIADFHEKISHSVEILARKAITILEDDQYNNVDFLSELESDLKEEFDKQLNLSAEFIIHGTGEVKTGLKKVQVAMNKQIEKHFPEGGGFLDRQRYHIDALKIYSDRFFKMADAIAHETIKAQQKVINELANYLTGSIEDRKKRIHSMIKELLVLRASAQTHLDHYVKTRKEFERIFNY